MKKTSRSYLPISTFSTSTRFGIDARVGVIESGIHVGCIEVHLAESDYNWDAQQARPGGKGLVIAGQHQKINDRSKLEGRYALVDGLLEVFAVTSHYDRVVILRPLGVGLGVRWELMRRYDAMMSRKRRLVKKHTRKAHILRAGVRHSVVLLTGRLDTMPRPEEGPYFLRDKVDRPTSKSEVQLPVPTLDEARQIARKRVQELESEGWKCGQPASIYGMIDQATSRTVTWLCQKGDLSRWVSVEHGQANA